MTNDQKLRHLINKKDDEIHPCKILGILWNEKNDTLCFDFSDIIEPPRSLKPSKRNVLKILAIFYDLLRILKPILISLKVLFQNLCKQKFKWDESISDEFKGEWYDILSYLGNVRTIEIPRKVLNHDVGDSSQRFELHRFSDTTQQSYCACIYLKFIFRGGKVSVRLIASKSRLAPTKEKAIPKLELLDSLILSRLMNSVKNALPKNVSFDDFYFGLDIRSPKRVQNICRKLSAIDPKNYGCF